MEIISVADHILAEFVIIAFAVEGQSDIPREHGDAITSRGRLAHILSETAFTDTRTMPCNLTHRIEESLSYAFTLIFAQVVVYPIPCGHSTYLCECSPLDIEIVVHTHLIICTQFLEYVLGQIEVPEISAYEIHHRGICRIVAVKPVGSSFTCPGERILEDYRIRPSCGHVQKFVRSVLHIHISLVLK